MKNVTQVKPTHEMNEHEQKLHPDTTKWALYLDDTDAQAIGEAISLRLKNLPMPTDGHSCDYGTAIAEICRCYLDENS